MSALLVALRVFRLYNCSPWDITFQLNSPQPSCSLLNWGKKIGKPKFNSGQVVQFTDPIILFLKNISSPSWSWWKWFWSVGWLLEAGAAVDDRADPQLTISSSSSHIETTGDASLQLQLWPSWGWGWLLPSGEGEASPPPFHQSLALAGGGGGGGGGGRGQRGALHRGWGGVGGGWEEG